MSKTEQAVQVYLQNGGTIKRLKASAGGGTVRPWRRPNPGRTVRRPGSDEQWGGGEA